MNSPLLFSLSKNLKSFINIIIYFEIESSEFKDNSFNFKSSINLFFSLIMEEFDKSLNGSLSTKVKSRLNIFSYKLGSSS